MRALFAALAALTVCGSVAACSTHRKELESEAPAQNAPSQSARELTNFALSLLDTEAGRIRTLPGDALAPLTDAATFIVVSTGSSRASVLGRRFANALLVAGDRHAVAAGIPAASASFSRQAQVTAVSGVALADAFAVLHDRRYQAAALADAARIVRPALGWTSVSGEVGVRAGQGRGPNVALTANAALLLERASALGTPRLISKAHAALRTIYRSQAAVGRWYADVGSHLPMSIGEWGTTLFVLSADGSKESIGILGAAVPALYKNTFDENGRLREDAQTHGQPSGVALAFRALAGYEDTALPDQAFRRLSKLRRTDGTITLAPSIDAVSQAYFALALAVRLASLSPVK